MYCTQGYYYVLLSSLSPVHVVEKTLIDYYFFLHILFEHALL